MKQVLIAPTERGYDLSEIKRAALVYDKVFLLEPDDRDLFPSNAMGMAMGMPPLISIPGRPVRPMAKTSDYNSSFELLIDDLKPLVKQGVIEVTSTYNRSVTEIGTIGMVDLGGYPLNVATVLQIYRALARGQDFLKAAIDPMALNLVRSEGGIFAEFGSADGGLNDDPPLPLFGGQLVQEELREALTAVARARIGTAIKIWGVAEQRDLVPLLPSSSAAILDQMATGLRTAVDAIDPDPYWTRRTAILDVALSEYFSEDRLEEIPVEALLNFRTAAMSKASEDRSRLFSEIRAMAGEHTNLDLSGFRERILGRVESYKDSLHELNEQRRNLEWTMKIEVAKGAIGTAAAATAAGGLFHIALPLSLSAAAFGAAIWSLGKIQEHLPDIREYMAIEREISKNAEFAVFKEINNLVEPFA